MPKETNLAARNDKGEVVLYHDSDYPSPALIELLEKYNSGSTAIVLEMVRKEQENSFTINNRNSKTACTSLHDICICPYSVNDLAWYVSDR